MAIIVNHVMSEDIHSGIFEDIMGYFQEYTPRAIEHVKSTRPIDGAHIRHYHRPHLEKRLIGPCLATVHHDLREPDGWLPVETFIERYREADAVVCLNTAQQRFLNAKGIAHTTVIPHGFHERLVQRLKSKGRIKRERFTLGLTSKRYARKAKGEAFLLELSKRLDPSLVEFLLIGAGRSEEGLALRALGFKVDVYERLPYEILLDSYRHMDALLMVSGFEGGPANIPEALAMEVPVLANPVGMVPDLVEHGRNGLHLLMDPAADAVTINSLAEPGSTAFRDLQLGSSQRTRNLISWEQSVSANVQEHMRLLTKGHELLSKLLETMK